MTITLLPEWAPQYATLLVWPHSGTDWKPYLERVHRTYLELTEIIAAHQKVMIVCRDTALKDTIFSELSQNAQTQCEFYCLPYNDTWVRDFGPITVRDSNGQLILTDFNFDGWGAKFASDSDNQITTRLIEQHAFPERAHQKVDWVLEGGSIDGDGQGTLLTTARCLLQHTRNHNINQREFEQMLKKYLGISRVLWLQRGYLFGDDTDGHVDTLARFLDPDTICYCQCIDREDQHYVELSHMEKELEALRKPDGSSYRLVPLPLPRAIYNSENRRLPATYLNFLFINHAVILPVYQQDLDSVAIHTLQQACPTRRVIPLDSRVLIEQSGSIHCASMQIPK